MYVSGLELGFHAVLRARVFCPKEMAGDRELNEEPINASGNFQTE